MFSERCAGDLKGEGEGKVLQIDSWNSGKGMAQDTGVNLEYGHVASGSVYVTESAHYALF